jgi:hypothetical protein
MLLVNAVKGVICRLPAFKVFSSFSLSKSERQNVKRKKNDI